MSFSTEVFCQTTFTAFHRWNDAPGPVSYLRNFHRHVFHVKLYVNTTHNNRDVEFITLKEELDNFLSSWQGKELELSCEQMAEAILNAFPEGITCLVSEDGENGAYVDRVYDVIPESPSPKQESTIPALRIRTDCFLGEEAEGPYRGRKLVLFIPGSFGVEKFNKALSYLRSVRGELPVHAYYGAGNVPAQSLYVLEAIKREFRNEITVEVESLRKSEWCAATYGLTVVSHDPEDWMRVSGSKHFIKIVKDNKVHWLGLKYPDMERVLYTTNLNDPIYSRDVGFGV
jgi:hypothetical protein